MAQICEEDAVIQQLRESRTEDEPAAVEAPAEPAAENADTETEEG